MLILPKQRFLLSRPDTAIPVPGNAALRGVDIPANSG